MAPFFPLYLRRSDGKASTNHAGVKNDPNQPIGTALDAKPNAKGIVDFYRPCPVDGEKEIDWRRKLAGMLIREIGGAETKGMQTSAPRMNVSDLRQTKHTSSQHYQKTIAYSSTFE
jgi:hypothetical protein